ncbi:MAG: hypothetical protein WCD79_06310 [Chthoniobacteraceae bacterium]
MARLTKSWITMKSAMHKGRKLKDADSEIFRRGTGSIGAGFNSNRKTGETAIDPMPPQSLPFEGTHGGQSGGNPPQTRGGIGFLKFLDVNIWLTLTLSKHTHHHAASV